MSLREDVFAKCFCGSVSFCAYYDCRVLFWLPRRKGGKFEMHKDCVNWKYLWRVD